MSSSFNRVQVIGNVGKDPSIRALGSGKEVASFSLAVSEKWRDKTSGEMKEKTEWIPVSVFNEGLVGIVKNYVKKGSRLYVEGAFQTRKWQDREGNDKYTTEVVLSGFGGQIKLLDAKGSRSSEPEDETQDEYSERGGSTINGREQTPPAKGNAPVVIDDDIPFACEWR